MAISNITAFKKKVWKYYNDNKRSFPWRETKDPYKILVSEIMLQQTQTERVKIKYAEWLEYFPTVHDLAQAPLQKVLQHWQGLGYNRRALALKKLSEIVTKKYSGKIPHDYEKILDLPGIGPYTAGAVMAFAFNKPFPIIETNIRTVYIHEFFGDQFGMIHDREILELVEKTLDKNNTREWYYALMDYGVHIKKTIGNANTRSRHYIKQSKFVGSNRQIRAALVRTLTTSPQTSTQLMKALTQEKISATQDQIQKNLLGLEKEGFIAKSKNTYKIAV